MNNIYFYTKYSIYINIDFYIPQDSIIKLVWCCKLQHSYYTKFIFEYNKKEFSLHLTEYDIRDRFIIINNQLLAD